MNKLASYLIVPAFVVMLLVQACKKESLCEGCVNGNKPPAAVAGPDQMISEGTDSVLLNGSGSYDADGTLISYKWTKIAGPVSITIVDPGSAQTVVRNLTEDVYHFELTVIDNGGLSAIDTVRVAVYSKTFSVACTDENRPVIIAQLIPVGKLSKARIDLAVASAGTKILFAGGTMTADCPECWGSSQVDIYDTATKVWTTAKLSEGRFGIKAITAGSKIFFAGGEHGDGANDSYYNNVDIYDASTNTWSVEHLSEPRSHVGAASLEDKLIFAGGEKNWNYDCSKVVDIYNLSTSTWSTATLSTERAYLSALSVNNKVYFAGGTIEDRWYTQSPRIDIYDNRTSTWSTSEMAVHHGITGGTVLRENIYWSGDCSVEIRNAYNGTNKIASLSHPGGRYSVVKNNKVVFMSGGDKFDIYDPATDKWSIGHLPKPIDIWGNVISVNNTIYLTDGSQVYQLEF